MPEVTRERLRGVIVVARTPEDWHDVQALLAEGARLGECATVLAFDTSPVYREGTVVGPPITEEMTSIMGRNPFANGYYSLGPLRRLLVVFVNAFVLTIAFRRYRVSAVVSAPPVAFVRLARFVSPRTCSVGYLRSAFPAPAARWSITERIEAFIHRLHLRPPAFLNAYWADSSLVAGTASADFLTSRGVSRETIHVIGPGRLGARRATGLNPPAADRRFHLSRVIYLAQAFLRHFDTRAHEAQVEAAERLALWLRAHAPELSFEIRLHPRDDNAWVQDLEGRLPWIEYSSGSPHAFLERVLSDGICVVGLTSTLLFEVAYLGGRAISFGTPAAVAEHKWFFGALGIQPYVDPERLWRKGLQTGATLQESAVSKVLALPTECEIFPFDPSFAPWIRRQLRLCRDGSNGGADEHVAR